MQEFFTILSNFGFPVAVASYLLFRFEKKLEVLENTNNELVQKVSGLQTTINDLKGSILNLEKAKNV